MNLNLEVLRANTGIRLSVLEVNVAVRSTANYVLTTTLEEFQYTSSIEFFWKPLKEEWDLTLFPTELLNGPDVFEIGIRFTS